MGRTSYLSNPIFCGVRGTVFENYNIERKAMDVDEKIVKPTEISNGYDLFSSTYYEKF